MIFRGESGFKGSAVTLPQDVRFSGRRGSGVVVGVVAGFLWWGFVFFFRAALHEFPVIFFQAQAPGLFLTLCNYLF